MVRAFQRVVQEAETEVVALCRLHGWARCGECGNGVHGACGVMAAALLGLAESCGGSGGASG
jgi:hypothetical protein